MSTIASNLQAVRERIVLSAQRCGRDPAEVRLIVVSKTFDARAVCDARAAGALEFGENYLQEALAKMAATEQLCPRQDAPLVWHMIGPIQSNKTRAIAEHFDWVHSIERAQIAQRLSAQRPASLAALKVCLQINVSGEASKSGVNPDELGELARSVADLPRLELAGLMAVPAPSDDPRLQRAAFARLRGLSEDLRAAGLIGHELSMGMSGDLESAIAEGATMVRVGTAIFGERAKSIPSSG